MCNPASSACAVLVLPRLQIQNANAISGPFSWGFPAPTAFTGFVHALQRRLAEQLDQGLGGVGVVCHHIEAQVAQPAGKRTQVFRLTRNPVGKDGGSTALVEEGRSHLEVTLVIAVHDYLPADEGKLFAEQAMAVVQGMRLAGGSLLPQRSGGRYAAQWWPLPEDRQGQHDLFRQLRRRLLPGFALVQREDRLAERLAELRSSDATANALDALLDLCRLNFEPPGPAGDNQADAGWHLRKRPGWLVPLPVGYAALSPLYPAGEVANGRDDATPLRFVESLYSLGEWLSPHRLDELSQLLWHSVADAEQGIYRCTNAAVPCITATP